MGPRTDLEEESQRLQPQGARGAGATRDGVRGRGAREMGCAAAGLSRHARTERWGARPRGSPDMRDRSPNAAGEPVEGAGSGSRGRGHGLFS